MCHDNLITKRTVTGEEQKQLLLSFLSHYSRTSKARTPFGQLKFVRDRGSSSQ